MNASTAKLKKLALHFYLQVRSDSGGSTRILLAADASTTRRREMP